MEKNELIWNRVSYVSANFIGTMEFHNKWAEGFFLFLLALIELR